MCVVVGPCYRSYRSFNNDFDDFADLCHLFIIECRSNGKFQCFILQQFTVSAYLVADISHVTGINDVIL